MCSSRPETPKILVITPDFVSKNCFFADFVIKSLFLCGFTPEFVKIRAFFEIKSLRSSCKIDTPAFLLGYDANISVEL